MAKLKAHGKELLRLEYVNHRTAYMADGTILRDYGEGWKLYGKFKDGVDLPAKVREIKAKYDARPTEFHVLVGRIVDAVGIKNRLMLWTYVETMPTDPDGCWAMMDDHRCRVEIEEVVGICNALRGYERVLQEKKAQAAFTVPPELTPEKHYGPEGRG